MHYIYQATIGDNHIANLHEPSAILDLGTGTGIWVLVVSSAANHVGDGR